MKSYKIINFPVLGDNRGSLIALEAFNHIPFDIKRVYYIFDTKKSISRGFHAHINTKQVIICLSGSCRFILDDGKLRDEIILNSPSKGILIDKLIWREMHDFSQNCILIVLASDYYDENDYIKKYDEFLKKCE